MKKILSVILALTLLCGMWGCSMPSQPDSTDKQPVSESTGPATSPSTEPSTPPENDTPAIPSAPMVAVSMPTTTVHTKADNGIVIFSQTSQELSMTLNDPEVAEKTILDFMNRVESKHSEVDNILSNATNDYDGSLDWNPYLNHIAYDPMRLDQNIFSLFGCYAIYQGSMHPETQFLSVNYDLVTGNTLSLDDILTDKTTPDDLYALVIDELALKDKDYYLFSDYQELVKPSFGTNIFRSENWYLSANGLCFFFQPYEIAPYASGVIVAEIPYEKLWGVLEDAFFPAETGIVSGQIAGKQFSNVKPNEFSKYGELILDDQADNIVVYTDGTIQNIRIEIGEWSASGAYFTPQNIVFAATSLSQGEAILIEAKLDNKLPSMRLYFESNGKTECRFIAKDESGNIVLKP